MDPLSRCLNPTTRRETHTGHELFRSLGVSTSSPPPRPPSPNPRILDPFPFKTQPTPRAACHREQTTHPPCTRRLGQAGLFPDKTPLTPPPQTTPSSDSTRSPPTPSLSSHQARPSTRLVNICLIPIRNRHRHGHREKTIPPHRFAINVSTPRQRRARSQAWRPCGRDRARRQRTRHGQRALPPGGKRRRRSRELRRRREISSHAR